MKLKSVVATAVLAAASFSASAATYDLGTLNPAGFDTLFDTSADFGANEAINDTWTFTLLTPSSTSFSALQTFATSAGQIMNFSAVLNGVSFGAPTLEAGSQTLSWTDFLAAGQYSVSITGMTGLAGAQYGATVSAQPVPEPETYAMMLGGLALLGAVARRKAKK
ncbi:MAG TPA: FxDxF family PEP-CTERM protein [Duganella sp.]|jgi:hypothetical protein